MSHSTVESMVKCAVAERIFRTPDPMLNAAQRNAVADYGTHHRNNQHVAFDVSGTPGSGNVNHSVMVGKRLRKTA